MGKFKEQTELQKARSELHLHKGPGSPDREAGMVTVETAIGLGAVVLVLVALLLALAVTSAQGQLCDAVRVGARAQSLGADPHQAASGIAGQPIHLSITGDDRWFTVTGTRSGLSLGRWSVGSLSCEVSGVQEMSWVGLLQRGA